MKAQPPASKQTPLVDGLPFLEAFESSRQFFCLLDVHGLILRVNRVLLEFGQLQNEQVCGTHLGDTPWWRHAGADEQSRLRQAITSAAAGMNIQYDVALTGHADQHAVVDFSIKPLRNADGIITHLLAEGHDITSRIEIEQRLRENEEKFRLISENADDLIALFDADGHRIYSSPSYARILPTADQSHLVDCFDLIHPDDRERILELVFSVGKTGQGQRAEFKYLMPDRQYRYLESQISIVHDEPGNPLRVLAVTRDIHDRKQVEMEILSLTQQLEQRIEERTQELIEANQKLRDEIQVRLRTEDLLQYRAEQMQQHRESLLQLVCSIQDDFALSLERILNNASTTLKTAQASFWVLDAQRQAAVCQQLFSHRANAMADEASGTKLEIARFPEYLLMLDSQRRIVINDLSSPAGRTVPQPNDPRHPNITALLDIPVWFENRLAGILRIEHADSPREWSNTEVDFAACLAILIALALETSQRSRMEGDLKDLQKKLQHALQEREAILENSWVGIAFLKDRRFVWANRALGELQGYHPDELIGTSTEPHFASSDIYAQHGLEAYEVLATGQTYSVVRLMRRRDGTLYWAKMHGRAIDANDLSKGVIWTVDDVSDRVRAEEEMLKSLQKEQELNELKSRFVSMTSHEFRTPLGTILSATELLECYRDRLPQEQQSELLGNIKRSVNHMATLLNDVLLIGQVDAGRFEFKPRELQLEAFCRKIVEEFRITAGDRIEYASGALPLAPRFYDEKLLRHILTNLLSNAIKYSPNGSKVYFSTEFSADATILRVKDNGIGIPEEDLPRLFESFHRARNVGDISGTGLGLSIVKRAVEVHGGSIFVDSAQNQGTTFMVTLPFHIDVEQA